MPDVRHRRRQQPKWPTGVPKGRPTAAEIRAEVVWAIRRLQAQGKPFGAKTIAAMIGVPRTTAFRSWRAVLPSADAAMARTALIFDGMKRLKRRGEAVTIEALAGEFGLPVNVVQQQIGP